MWFSTDGEIWDGPHIRPDGLATGWLPPLISVGSDTIFGGGGDFSALVVGRQVEPGGYGIVPFEWGVGTTPAPCKGGIGPNSDAAPPGDDAVAVDAGAQRLPLGDRTDLPDSYRLDFLNTAVEFDDCYRDAVMVDPNDEQSRDGVWWADTPFHVRHGFINEGQAPLGDGFEVVVYVTRRSGPELDGGVFEEDRTYRFSSDYVLRGTTTKCGPGYWEQAESHTCEWFVHDFPDGLPPGRYDIWAQWHAPCSAWLDLGLTENCDDPTEVTSLFASSVNMPFYGNLFPDGE
jgi:hypothetical protein